MEAQNAACYSPGAWQELIFNAWFRQLDDGRNLDPSGFERVAVGERNGGKINGRALLVRCVDRLWPWTGLMPPV